MNEPRPQALLRAALGIALPLLLVAATLLPLRLFHDRLPEPLATHWGLDGRPDGTMSMAGLIIFLLAFGGIPAAGMALLAHRRGAVRGEIAPAMAIAAFIAGLMAVVSWLIVLRNLDAAVWTSAGSVGLTTVAIPLLAASALAAGVTRYGHRLETASAPLPDLPRVGLAPGARAVWVGSAHSIWAMPLTIAFVTLGVIAASWRPSGGLLFAAIALAGLPFTSIRLTVDRNGLRIVYGALGWPVQRVRLTDIQQASVLQVNPMTWGGWGYRGSLRMTGKAAVVLRGGEGMRLDLVNGRILVVTIDDAARGAGLINDLLSAPQER